MPGLSSLRASLAALALPLALLLALALASTAGAEATVRAVDPDTYTCPYPGYVDFERFADKTDLSAEAFPGIEFTTTGGFTWRVGDWDTGQYNGKYPGNGRYTSQGTHWAWLGTEQGAGRIDLTLGHAQVFSLLTSANTPMYLEAYDDGGNLLETAGPAPGNLDTAEMSELRIARPSADIAYVIVHDTGNFFAVDGICSDARGVSAVDTDGDGLPDDWETNGADIDANGSVDLDLAAMGASPTHKDLFVEVDWLTKDDRKLGPINLGGGFDARPSTAAAKNVTAAFNAFPVPNPDGSQGIHLHLDAGADSIMNPVGNVKWGALTRANAIRNGLRYPDWPGKDWRQLDTFRNANVETARRGIFHYVLYVDEIGCDGDKCTTGYSRGIPGHDLVLAKDDPDDFFHNIRGVATDRQEGVTLAHELGHNLGLGHGGRERDDDPRSQFANFKANYLSIMNYFYSNTGLIRTDGSDGHIQYSSQELDPLDPQDLDETGGLDPNPTDHLRVLFFCPSGKVSPPADSWSSIDWDCGGGQPANGSSNDNLQSSGCITLNGSCETPDLSQVLSSDDYHSLHFWGVGRGWDARNQALVGFDQPGTAEPPIAQAIADGVWWPSKSLVAPNEVAVTVYPRTGHVAIPLTLSNPGAAPFTIQPQLDSPRPWLALPNAAAVAIAPGATPGVSLDVNTDALSRNTTADALLDYLDTDGTALGDSHLTLTVADVGDPTKASCATARGARATPGLPPAQAPAIDAFLASCARAPVISGASMTHRRFALANGRTALSARRRHKAHKRKGGTAFAFSLSERARTKIAIQQRRPARSCRAARRRRHARSARRCTRTVTLVTLTRTHTRAGGNRVKFSGRYRRHALAPGRYRARLSATDATGNRSKPVVLRFRVVRR
jgi:hypothetical protein